MTLAFDTIEIARAMKGSADNFVTFEATEVPHTWILISSHAIMAMPSTSTMSGREIMLNMRQFAATGKVEPLFVARYIEVRDGCVGSVVNGLIEDKPSTLLGVGVDNVWREQITHVIHDDNFWFCIFHKHSQSEGC